MYFEAKMKGKNYKINVNEEASHWSVSIQEENKEWVHHDIQKNDYQTLEDTISLLFKDQSYLIDVIHGDVDYEVYTRGSYRSIQIFNDEMLLHESLKGGSRGFSQKDLKSGMPGKIIQIKVKEGDSVQEGDPLLVMEAMKMENELRAPSEAKIKKIHVSGGDAVEKGTVLIEFA